MLTAVSLHTLENNRDSIALKFTNNTYAEYLEVRQQYKIRYGAAL